MNPALFTMLSRRPEKDPEIGAYRCQSCGTTIFHEAWHCDDCRTAIRKPDPEKLKLCLVLIVIGLLIAGLLLVITN